MLKLFLLLVTFCAALSDRNSLTVKEYNQAFDKAIKDVFEPILTKLPMKLNDYQHEIFFPQNTVDRTPHLLHFDPPRFNVVLRNIRLQKVGTIQRVGDCLAPDPQKRWEPGCLFKVQDYAFSAKGKSGEVFSEKLTFTFKLDINRFSKDDGFIVYASDPWATWTDTLSPHIKQYLKKADSKEVEFFIEYVVNTYQKLFLDYDELTKKFNEALKGLKTMS